MTIPEPARALGWHLARAAVLIAAAASVIVYGSLLVLAAATALAGYGTWWVPVVMLAALIVPIGGVTWWRAGMVRPGQGLQPIQEIGHAIPLTNEQRTAPASDVLRGHLTADIRRVNL